VGEVTAEIGGEAIAEALRSALPNAVVGATPGWVEVRPETVLEASRWLRDSPRFDFRQLLSLTAVDRFDRFEVVYHLLSLHKNQSGVLKTVISDREEPAVDSVVPVWYGAILQEREVYDLFGIRFREHPDMRRLFLWEGFSGWPLRKDFLQIPGHHPGLAGFPHEVPGEELDLTPRGTL
jgi:NADH-quinone oxidoreductase subunit C